MAIRTLVVGLLVGALLVAGAGAGGYKLGRDSRDAQQGPTAPVLARAIQVGVERACIAGDLFDQRMCRQRQVP